MNHSKRHLPKQVDVFKLTQQGIVLDGVVGVKELGRLAKDLSHTSENFTDLHAVLNFGVDAEGYRVAQGQVHARLPVTCQRCLQTMPYDVQADVNWAFVTTDEAAKKLPEHLDPIMVPASGYVDVHEMLEDELLLSLPITVFHDDCEGAGVTKVFGEAKPFTALADLLKSSDVKKGR